MVRVKEVEVYANWVTVTVDPITVVPSSSITVKVVSPPKMVKVVVKTLSVVRKKVMKGVTVGVMVIVGTGDWEVGTMAVKVRVVVNLKAVSVSISVTVSVSVIIVEPEKVIVSVRTLVNRNLSSTVMVREEVTISVCDTILTNVDV